MKVQDAKLQTIERLLGMAQIIRRKGTPDEAAAVLPYEQQLQKDLEARKTELAKNPEPMAA